MAFENEFAQEVVTARELEAKAVELDTVEAWQNADAAFSAMLDALRASAEIALHYRSKATAEQHDSADQNAEDTLQENGIDPASDLGRLVYNRIYVETLKLV